MVQSIIDTAVSHSNQSVCPVVAAFVRQLNDRLPDDATRTRLLLPLVPRLVGSRSTPEIARRRAYLAADWAVREAAPAALEAVALHVPALAAHATTLRALPTIGDEASALAARDRARDAADDAAYAAADAAYAYAADAWSWESAVALVERMLAVTEQA